MSIHSDIVRGTVYPFLTDLWSWKVLCLLCISALVSTRKFTHISYQNSLRNTLDGRKPPLVPYAIPFVGHLLSFLRDPAELFISVSNRVGPGIPCRVKLFLQEVYIISEQSSINLLWANSDVFTPKSIQLMGMRNILKLNPSGMDFCRSDDSGRGQRPHPRSNVRSENRIWFQTHNSAATFLSGPHLQTLIMYFQCHLNTRVDALSLDHRRSSKPDLYAFLYDIMFPTQIEVLFGKSFLRLNPTFTADFRAFHQGLPYLLRGYPRWMIPKAWDARESCLDSIKRWHVYIHEQDRKGKIELDQDRYWLYGSEFIRDRRQKHSKMHSLDADAIASSELGVIWAANSNIISATFWYIIELAKDPNLLYNILSEVSSSLSQPNNLKSHLDAEKLSTQPRIQSGYAEILRLHAYNFLATSSEHDDFNFRGWNLPKDQMVAISSHTAHMDIRSWNTSLANTEHPLHTFWPERFIRYESDPRSGPLKAKNSRHQKQQKPSDQRRNVSPPQKVAPDGAPASPESPKFSLTGLSGIWMPFGGGYSLCPGRHIAKEEILLTVATLSRLLEFEVVDSGKGVWDTLMDRMGISYADDYQRDMRYFGMGILPSSKKVAVVQFGKVVGQIPHTATLRKVVSITRIHEFRLMDAAASSPHSPLSHPPYLHVSISPDLLLSFSTTIMFLLHPVTAFLIQNSFTILSIASIPPHHPSRLAILVFSIAYLSLTFSTYLDKLHYRVFASVLFGTTFSNVLRYLDIVVLSHWSFENGGPAIPRNLRAKQLSSRDDIIGLVAERKDPLTEGGSSSTTGRNGTLLQRLRYGYFINCAARLIGTPHIVKNVPSYSTSDSSYIPTRTRFLIRKFSIFCVSYLVLDFAVSSVNPSANTALYHPSNIPLFRRWKAVDAAELVRKAIGGVAYWAAAYCTIELYMGAWAFVCVASGDDPKYWRPNFGRLSEGYTVRRFWGIFWHQHLRRSFTSISTFLTHSVLRLPEHSLIARYTNLTFVFALSGLLHALAEIAAHGGGGDGASMTFQDTQAMNFFLAQALGIMLEDGVQHVARYVGMRPDTTRGPSMTALTRVAGWVWVVAFLGWSTPALMYPAARLNTGKGSDTLLPISIVKAFTPAK